jgi:serralysin
MPAVTTVTASGDQDIDGMLYNQKWAVNSFTFSFPADASFYQAGSAPNGETIDNFAALNSTAQDYVRNYAYAQFAAVANLTFSEMTETSSNHADLRFAETDATDVAFGYYPAADPSAGGSWYRNSGGDFDDPELRRAHLHARDRPYDGPAAWVRHRQSVRGAAVGT